MCTARERFFLGLRPADDALSRNVIMGRLIPAGTGMEYYRRVKIPDEVIEHPVLEGPSSDYSPEYLVEPEYIKDQTEVTQK